MDLLERMQNDVLNEIISFIKISDELPTGDEDIEDYKKSVIKKLKSSLNKAEIVKLFVLINEYFALSNAIIAVDTKNEFYKLALEKKEWARSELDRYMKEVDNDIGFAVFMTINNHYNLSFAQRYRNNKKPIDDELELLVNKMFE